MPVDLAIATGRVAAQQLRLSVRRGGDVKHVCRDKIRGALRPGHPCCQRIAAAIDHRLVGLARIAGLSLATEPHQQGIALCNTAAGACRHLGDARLPAVIGATDCGRHCRVEWAWMPSGLAQQCGQDGERALAALLHQHALRRATVGGKRHLPRRRGDGGDDQPERQADHGFGQRKARGVATHRERSHGNLAPTRFSGNPAGHGASSADSAVLRVS
ncbi:hypothetical protein CTP10_R25000 [Cupriavidus sp. P-10]|nr:hypothetical protein CTP10_R25000 [Cupriavidus sp. P-10]